MAGEVKWDELMDAFADMPDPRRAGSRMYPLEELLLTALCAIASGAEDWVHVALFGQIKLDWLRRFLPFENGAASHDTFSRLFAQLDAVRLERCFRRWMQGLCRNLDESVIAIDGKALRGSGTMQGMVHMVSAWSASAGMTLGQVKTEAKSNEITAIPQLLEALELRGATITMDAMGCQKAIVSQLVKQGRTTSLASRTTSPHWLRRCRPCWTDKPKRPRPRWMSTSA